MFFSHGTKEDALVVGVKAYPCGIYDMGAWEQKQGMEWRDERREGAHPVHPVHANASASGGMLAESTLHLC